MCGIAGLFAFDGRAAEPALDELQRMSVWQRNRGPDDHGVWQSNDKRCALDHRRLAIIDVTSDGHQPMVASDHGLCITFNGEIYNYRELRAELEQTGEIFRSASDTEVLLKLYAAHGSAMLDKLRGMYAFAIWDEKRRGLFLARDPLGIKPLYYASSDGIFRFASQVRAVLAGAGVSTAGSAAAQAGFLIWGSVPEPLTWWSAISALPAGNSLWVDHAGVGRARQFFDLARQFERKQLECPPIDLCAVIGDSVSSHLVADVPVGVFLSSGIDSIVLANLASRQAREQLRSVTIGFDAFRKTERDECAVAASVAACLGMQHSIVEFGHEDFAAHRTSILHAMDQPTIDGINTYFVSLAAKQAGLKVALSGVGGDELLGGYPSFSQIPSLVRWLAPFDRAKWAGSMVRAGLAPILSRFVSPKYASILEYGTNIADAYMLRRGLFLPWELERVLGRDRAAHALGALHEAMPPVEPPAATPYAVVSYLEFGAYMRNQLLRDTDWASMANGVETRVPFADAKVLGLLAPRIASGRPPAKRDLVSCVDDDVWQKVRQLSKRGFEVPISDWMRASGSRRSDVRGWRGWALEVMDEFATA